MINRNKSCLGIISNFIFFYKEVRKRADILRPKPKTYLQGLSIEMYFLKLKFKHEKIRNLFF